jgi:hypothetical protein
MLKHQRLIAGVLAVFLVAAGFMLLSGDSSSGQSEGLSTSPSVQPNAAATAETNPNSEQAYLTDFKAGYSDGFATGAVGYPYPDQGVLTGRTGGYLGGFEQGYADGQNNQSVLQDRLCNANLSAAPAPSGYYTSPSSSRTSRVLGERVESRRVDNGLGSGTRKAILIGSSAAAGAGIGAAVGGRKGALIGALAGGGTGTALALTNRPKRAFNRRVSGKSLAIKTAIGAGAGAVVGALAGGKRGAGAGAAIGGGSGAIWSLLDGERRRR